MPEPVVLMDDRPVRRSPDALATQVDGDIMMLVLSTGMYHSLSGVAARIWELLDTPATLDGISARIADEYAIPLERSRTDTQVFLENLLRAGLLETA